MTAVSRRFPFFTSVPVPALSAGVPSPDRAWVLAAITIGSPTLVGRLPGIRPDAPRRNALFVLFSLASIVLVTGLVEYVLRFVTR